MDGVLASFNVELQPLVGGHTQEFRAQLFKEGSDSEIGGLRFDGPRLKLADIQQGVEQPRHRTDRLILLREGFGDAGIAHDPAQGTIDQGKRLQRLAQVMTGGSQKAALALIGAIGTLARLIGKSSRSLRRLACHP